MLFLPSKILKTVGAPRQDIKYPDVQKPFYIFPAHIHLQGFSIQLRQYFRSPISDIDRIMPIKQQEILLLLYNDHRQEVAEFIRTATTTADEQLEYVIKTNLLHPINLTELASLTNRSLATFKRDFVRLYGMSPGNWITEQRLTHARLLLQNTNQPIAEIGFDCGFENAAHFSRAFKRKYGYPPSASRADLAIV